MNSVRPGPFGFPIMVEVRDQSVFVAGGGREAWAKARMLAELGARVVIWTASDASGPDVPEHPGLVTYAGTFDPELLDGARLAVVDTGERELDHRIATEARRRHVLVNTVDDIPYCDWSAPAILRRGDLTIAIASAGVAPALASRLRDRLRTIVGPEYGDLLAILGGVRPRIAASGRPFADRRRLWYELVDGPALDHLVAGRGRDARDTIQAAVEAWEARS
jgi:siroheme synthase-like protein